MHVAFNSLHVSAGASMHGGMLLLPATEIMLLLCMQAPCSLDDSQAFDGLTDNFGVVLSSRWHGVYALVAMLILWRCLHAAFLYMRVRLWY